MALKINRTASAHWTGGLKDGKGAISLESGAMKDYPYGFAARFEGQKGTNPEELLGAAHAGCFTMALSLILGEAKLTAERMDTAEASSARPTHCMPPCTIGCLMPNISVKRVLIIVSCPRWRPQH